MGWKDFWSRATTWLTEHRPGREHKDYQPQIDSEGLMSHTSESDRPGNGDGHTDSNHVVVKAAPAKGKNESLERIQVSFDRLVGQLHAINDHLGKQLAQHQELMARIDQLPKLLESWPAVVQNQNQLTEQLFEQLKANITKDEQLLHAVGKIPTETAKQTDAMVEINHQLAAAADTDVQMTESFNKFNETLDRLNQTTGGHKDSIIQMSKTFAASDRYLKYVMTRQNRRFWWMFITAVGVCLFVILVFTGIIIYLGR